MEESQVARQDGAKASESKEDKETSASNISEKSKEQEELGEKMKNIEMKPTMLAPAFPIKAPPQPTGRVKQLRDTALGQASPGQISSGSATGNPRNKTALAPGHSLMDWIRLGASGVDLTGVGGRLLTVTPAELARHNKESDAWIAIRGIVFNITRYKDFHPGGVPELMKGVGKDATKLFDDVHAWVNYQSILQKCVVGRLERSVSADLLFSNEMNEPKKKAKNEVQTRKAAGLRLDWRQTSNSLSLFFTSVSEDGVLGECQLKCLSERELRLGVVLEASGEVVRHCLKLTEDIVWPASCRRNEETREIEVTLKKKERGIWKNYGTDSVSREKKKLEENKGKRTYNEYELLENKPLAKVVHLLVLRARNCIQMVPTGRHVEVKMDVMGTEVSRPYTPVPSCLHPENRPASVNEEEDCLCLMVKRYDKGTLSEPLVALQPGAKLLISNAIGDFSPEKYDDCTTLHLLAAGSGLTVMLSIIRRAISRRSSPSINLINFNKDEDNVFYEKELDLVARERKLKVTHVLTTAGSSWDKGRQASLSEELLKELLGEYSSKAYVFTCGPPGFMQAAREYLRNLGWEKARLHEFDG